jgi:hypothetical protein
MEKNNVYSDSVGNPEGKRPLGRTRRRLEDTFKIAFRELRWGEMVLMNLAQDMDQ